VDLILAHARLSLALQAVATQAPPTGLLLGLMGAVAVICAALLILRTGRGAGDERMLATDADLAPGALRGYTLALLDAQRFQEAEQALIAHLNRVPSDTRMRAVQAALFVRRGEHTLAVSELQRASQILRRDGDQLPAHIAPYAALLLIAQAVELEAVGNAADAATCMREALSFDPQAAAARPNCIRLLVEAARDSEVERSLFERLSNWDDGISDVRPLGFVDVTAAVRFYRRARSDHRGDSRLLGDLGEALQANGDQKAAERAFKESLQANPRDAWVQCALGTLYWRMERLPEAQRTLAEAAQTAPRQAAIRATFALFLQQIGQPQEAERELVTAVNARPDVWVLFRLLGSLMVAQNRLPHALRAFQEAERLGATDTAFRLDYARVLAQADRSPQAEEQYRLALRSDARNGTPYAEYGAFLFARLRLEEAEQQCQQALFWPDSEAAYETLAGLCVMERRLDDAIGFLRAAQENGVQTGRIQQYQAEWLLLRGRAPEAATLAQRLTEQAAPSATVHLIAGGALLALDRQLEAQAAFREALRVDPNLPPALLRQARALRDLGYVAAAKETLAQALAVAPGWPEAIAEQQQLTQQPAVEPTRGRFSQRPRS